jgi:iron complex transport system permease protein
VVAVLAAVGTVSLVVALMTGSVAVEPGALVDALRRGPAQGDTAAGIVLQIRLPRALAAFAVGGLLALSGALLQALLRNPLADPYVLGISGGAAVCALGAMALGASLAGVQAAAGAGALLTLMLLFALARRAFFGAGLQQTHNLPGDEAATGVLLTGVMIAAFASALLSVVLTLADESRLRSMVFWLLGELSGATRIEQAAAALAMLALCLAVMSRHAAALNLLLRGDALAYTQGVDVAASRRVVVLVAGLATGTAVTLAGAVGFVGFVAPHLVRLVSGNDQRLLLPAAALVGGTLVVTADTLARTLFAPVQLPVGVVTALLGVPVFLWMLRRR